MTAGLLSALGAALAFGLATALQAVGAARAADRRTSALRQPWTLFGTVLDGVGVLLSLVGLRSLPLFVVQAVLSANLAVAAVAAWLLLGQALRRRHWAAVLLVTAGLALVGSSASVEPVVRPPGWLAAALVVAAVATAGCVGLDTARRSASGVLLGVVAGCGFAVYATAVRALPDLALHTLLTSPTAYAGALGGGVAFISMLRGLERSSVASVTAPIVVLETVLPSLVGTVALGDRPSLLAVGGFVLAVIGALGLADSGVKT